jgi:hypothetical protein
MSLKLVYMLTKSLASREWDCLMSQCHVNKIKKKAVSQVIGSLIMLAIVASIGSVMLIQGLTGINSFNTLLSGVVSQKKIDIGESLLIEHVRFDPTGSDMDIWVRNVGTSDATIEGIKIVRVNNQMLYSSSLNQPVYIKELKQIHLTSVSTQLTSPAANWNSLSISDNDEFRITISTQRGNTYSTVASRYNV